MRIKLYLKLFFSKFLSILNWHVLINLLKFQLNKKFPALQLNFYPISLVISATKRCNFTCDFCFVEEYMSESLGLEGDLSSEEFEKILLSDYGKKALRVGFLGGEPFLNKNIFNYFERAYHLGKITTVVTNSSLLKGDMLERLKKSRVDVIGLSLYDNNVEDVKRVSLALKGHKLFWIQTILNSNNYRKMESVIEFCIRIGCQSLIFDNYFPVDQSKINLSLYEDNIEYKNEMKRLEKIFKGKISITWVPLLQRQIKKRSCNLPFSYIQLDNKGTIGPCCVRAPDKKYGNIFIEPGWNSDEMIKIRNGLISSKISDLHPDCKHCQCLSDDLYGV